MTLIYFCLPLLIFAAGQAEEQLAEAQRLIDEKNYAQAMSILSQIGLNDPTIFNRVEELNRQIRQAQASYNQTFDQLIQALDKGDVEKALVLIKELEEQDLSPTETTKKIIETAKDGAEISAILNRFNEVMDRGLYYLRIKEYNNAIKQYLAGYTEYDLGKERFYNTGYTEEFEQQVKNRIAETEAAIKKLQGYCQQIEDQTKEFSPLLVAAEKDALIQAVNTIASGLRGITAQKYLLLKIAESFQEQNRQLKLEGKEAKGSFYLSFSRQIIDGRSTSSFKEGILHTIDQLFEQQLTTVQTQTRNMADKILAFALEKEQQAEFTAAQEELVKAHDLYLTGIKLSSLWSSLIILDANYSLDENDQAVINYKLPLLLYFEEMARETTSYQELIDYKIRLAQIKQGDITRKSTLLDTDKAIKQELTSLKTISDAWYKQQLLLETMLDLDIQTDKSLLSLASLQNYAQKIVADYQEQEILVNNTLAAMDLEVDSSLFAQKKDEFTEAQKRMNGIEEDDFVKKYPSQSLVVYKRVDKEITAIQKEVKSLRQDWSAFSSYIVASSGMQENLKQADDLITQIDTLKGQIGQQSKLAGEQIFQAQKHRDEGLKYYNEARQAFNAKKYDIARQKVGQTTETLTISLTYEYDEKIRQIIDIELANLSDDIIDAEAIVVVKQVREYITRGSEYLIQGFYDQAGEYFNKAKTRWADAKGDEENPEIKYWLERLDNAKKATTGREISKDDPGYPVMISFYNRAVEDFEEGKIFKTQGGDYMSKFNSAMEKIELIQLQFPYHKDTRVLALKIIQQTNERAFNEYFTRKYNEALRLPAREQLAELEDLSVINPRYPGLATTIKRLKINLGILPPDPDPAKIVESKRLYAEAVAIYKSGKREDFTFAIQILKQAITANPQNNEAKSLLDEIQIRIGGDVSITLTSADQIKYNKAETLYRTQDFLEAKVLIDQLWQNTRNRTNPNVIKLKEKIESKI